MVAHPKWFVGIDHAVPRRRCWGSVRRIFAGAGTPPPVPFLDQVAEKEILNDLSIKTGAGEVVAGNVNSADAVSALDNGLQVPERGNRRSMDQEPPVVATKSRF